VGNPILRGQQLGLRSQMVVMMMMMMMMMMKDKQHIIEDEIKKAHVRFLSLYGIVLNLGLHAFQIFQSSNVRLLKVAAWR
jgi:uncharacterized membrane protein